MAEPDLTGSIPPGRPWERAALERAADALLGSAHSRLMKSGAVWDGEGRRVWSTDGFDEVEAPDLVLGGTTVQHDAVDDLVASLDGVLTRSELQIAEAIADGAPSPGGADRVVWTKAISTLTGKTPNTVRVTWSNVKKKLITEWANEPERHERTVVAHSNEGTGDRLIIGREKDWKEPRVAPLETEPAMDRYAESRFRDRDWNYERSLTDDGWQLGDDAFWAL